MINFREMVSEALKGSVTIGLLSEFTGNGAFIDIITYLNGKYVDFDSMSPTLNTPAFYDQAWKQIGPGRYYTDIVNNPLYHALYPFVDFLFCVKQYINGPTKNGNKQWGTDKFEIADVASVLANGAGLTKIEDTFFTHVNNGSTCTGPSPLFNYTPSSSYLKTWHQKIKDGVLGANLVGKKTIENCQKKGYTVRQAIYLATQLRQRNMPIVSSIPATNKAIDDFLYQSVTNTNAYLGGSVSQSRPATKKYIGAAIKSKISAVIKPKTIPTAVKDMVETLLSFMDSVKSYADILTPLPLPPKTQTLDELKKSVDAVLNKKVKAIATGPTDIEKEIYTKLMNMLNHVPGEKDWVGKIQSAAAGMKSLENALGGANM